MTDPKITAWYSSDGMVTPIESLALSQLMSIINFLKGMKPSTEFSRKVYPKGTTAAVLLKVMEEERVNRRLRRNSKMFE